MACDETEAAAVISAGPFGRHELPYGVFTAADLKGPRIGVAVGDQVLDLAGFFDSAVFARPSLNAFMAQGPSAWTSTRERVRDALESARSAARTDPFLVSQSDVVMHLPFEVADFVDFYSSIQHATNASQILRPGQELIRPNWRQQPVGYHGRAGTVVVSGLPVRRPHGQIVEGSGSVLAPTKKLDVEAEIGFVVGAPTRLGNQMPIGHFADHVFGAVLLLDWSARDIQSFEAVPLGPFLGKSFATTISPWVLPLEALSGARVPAPQQDPLPPDYLRSSDSWALDVRLELAVNGCVVSRPRFDSMYWTAAQQLAHLTVNGAALRTGDLFGSGTVSDEQEFGSFLELSWDGERPLQLPDGSVRSYLDDGDIVTLTASAPDAEGGQVSFGAASGAIASARLEH